MDRQSNSFFSELTAQIMLLGTFHFQDRGLDAYKPQLDVDILSPQRQQEVTDVVERLARFQPAKIAIERRPERQAEIDQEYRAYLGDAFPLPGDEVYQLGFQLAKRLGHASIHCVDAWGRYYEPPLDLEAYAANRTTRELQQLLAEQFDFDPFRDLMTYAREHGQEALLAQWQIALQKAGESGDQAKTQRTLRETLLLGNREEHIWRSHHPYLVGPFKIGVGNEYPGVDYVAAWYSRNLRIFANLQRLREAADDRILLIIGAGHLPILRHCVLTSPEYALVEVHDYLA
jgi:hypothetical protein